MPTVTPTNIPGRLGPCLVESAGEQFGIANENPGRNPAGSDLALLALARVDYWEQDEDGGLPLCTATSYKAAFMTDMGTVLSLWFSASEVVNALVERGANPDEAATWAPMPEERVRGIMTAPDDEDDMPDMMGEVLRRMRQIGGGQDN